MNGIKCASTRSTSDSDSVGGSDLTCVLTCATAPSSALPVDARGVDGLADLLFFLCSQIVLIVDAVVVVLLYLLDAALAIFLDLHCGQALLGKGGAWQARRGLAELGRQGASW